MWILLFFCKFVFAFLKILPTDILAKAFVAERKGSYPQECQRHELADKHVARGYRDLVNAASWFMETGSISRSAATPASVKLSIQAIESKRWPRREDWLLPKQQWFSTWCPACGKKSAEVFQWDCFSREVKWTIDMLGILPTPTPKKTLYNLIIFIEATWQDKESPTDQV